MMEANTVAVFVSVFYMSMCVYMYVRVSLVSSNLKAKGTIIMEQCVHHVGITILHYKL